MNTRSLAVAALAAALLGVGSMVHTDQPPATHVQIVQAAGNRMSTAQVAESADHVLVADVVRLLGTDTGSGLPRTRFEVTVLGNLFGSLPRTVEVMQVGGADTADHRLVLVEGDRTLVPGDRVLLATRTTAAGLQVIPAAGNRRLDVTLPWELQPAVQTMRTALSNRS